MGVFRQLLRTDVGGNGQDGSLSEAYRCTRGAPEMHGKEGKLKISRAGTTPSAPWRQDLNFVVEANTKIFSSHMNTHECARRFPSPVRRGFRGNANPRFNSTC